MNYAADRELASQDRAIERRVHHDEFIKRKPEYLDLERQRVCEQMDATLREADRKALERRFESPQITAMGELA